jgi:hypothetical protein
MCSSPALAVAPDLRIVAKYLMHLGYRNAVTSYMHFVVVINLDLVDSHIQPLLA